MVEKQNDNRNQQAGGKSNQETQEGYKKTTDPNNPTANQGTQQGRQQEGSASQQDRTGTHVAEVDEREEESTDETTIQRKPGESDGDYLRRKRENEDNKKRNM